MVVVVIPFANLDMGASWGCWMPPVMGVSQGASDTPMMPPCPKLHNLS